jgi:four helix bundle protein
MNNAEFNSLICERTFVFARMILEFVESLPFNTSTKVMGDQLLRAGTSVGANFRAFCRGRSRNEKFSKICIVVEEADETLYWLRLFESSKYGDKDQIKIMAIEGDEILKITSSIKNGLYQNR